MKPVKPGIVGVALVTAVLVTMVPNSLIGSHPASRDAQGPAGISPLVGAPDPRGDLPNYASHVGAIVDRFWAGLFRHNNAAYRTPRLLITSRNGVGGCGSYSLRMGPFYCSADATIYLPNGYFSALVRGRQVTPGDFAPAYVMAHEWGHHVQALYGLQAMRDRELRKADAAGRQAVSINYELQADCFAGTWARDAFGRGMLEPGDIEEAQASAVQIGDDNLGLELRHWGHGSSAQRFAAFNHGVQSGDPSKCKLLTSETRTVGSDALDPRTLKVGSYELGVPAGSTVTRLHNGGYQIHRKGITVHVGSAGGVAAGPASTHVVAAMRAWNVGAPLSPVGDARTRQQQTPAGTVAMHAYDQNAGTAGRVHGLFLLHLGAGPTPEGIIVDVFTDGPARGANDWAQLEQMIQSLAGTLVFKRPW